MLNDEFFREELESIINSPESYTKEEIHEAFLVMTEKYLNEMINTMNLEREITKGMDKDSANEKLEEIATSNPSMSDLDHTNALSTDKKEVIDNLMAYIEFEFGIDII